MDSFSSDEFEGENFFNISSGLRPPVTPRYDETFGWLSEQSNFKGPTNIGKKRNLSTKVQATETRSESSLSDKDARPAAKRSAGTIKEHVCRNKNKTTWSESAVDAFLSCLEENLALTNDYSKLASVMQKCSDELETYDFIYTKQECKKKWKSLMMTYNKNKDKNDSIWKYFQRIHSIVGDGCQSLPNETELASSLLPGGTTLLQQPLEHPSSSFRRNEDQVENRSNRKRCKKQTSKIVMLLEEQNKMIKEFHSTQHALKPVLQHQNELLGELIRGQKISIDLLTIQNSYSSSLRERIITMVQVVSSGIDALKNAILQIFVR